MKRLEQYHYKKQIKIRVALVLLFLLIWVFSITYLSIISKTINLSIVIFGTFVLLLGLFLWMSNNKNKTKKTIVRNYKIIEIVLLTVSVYLMIFNYTIYGVWDLLFKFVTPSVIVGFVFVLALFLGLFIQNNIVKNIFIPVICIYPIKFLNIESYWMIYGSVISAMLIAEIFNTIIDNLKTNLHLAENVNTKIINMTLKILAPILIIALIMHFMIGYEAKASFANTISIEWWHSLLSIFPFLLFVFVLFFEIDLKLLSALFLLSNGIMTILLKNFSTATAYNSTEWILLDTKLFVQNDLINSWFVIFKALGFSWILACFCFTFEEWKIFNINFKLLPKIDGNINRYKGNDKTELKLFIIRAAFSKAIYFANDKMIIDIFFKLNQTHEDMQLNKHILLLFLKKTVTYLLPLNFCILSIVFSGFLLEIFQTKLLLYIIWSNFSTYLSLLFCFVLIFWAKFQNVYLGKWTVTRKKRN